MRRWNMLTYLYSVIFRYLTEASVGINTMYTPVRLGSVIFIFTVVVNQIWDYIEWEWLAMGLIKVLESFVYRNG
jgi:hypothetical protein